MRLQNRLSAEQIPTWVLATAMGLLCAVPVIGATRMTAEGPVLKHSEIVFMYAADSKAYRAYGATFVGWGGANTAAQVKRHHDLGIRCTG